MNDKAPETDNSIRRYGAVAVVVREDQFLVIRRSALVLAPGLYCFPGGGIEGDESEEQAIVREIREELGVAIRPVRRVWRNVTRWRVDLAWWLGELEASAQLIANPAEVESVHWWTREEMAAEAKMLESNHDFLKALALGEIELG